MTDRKRAMLPSTVLPLECDHLILPYLRPTIEAYHISTLSLQVIPIIHEGISDTEREDSSVVQNLTRPDDKHSLSPSQTTQLTLRAIKDTHIPPRGKNDSEWPSLNLYDPRTHSRTNVR